MQHTKAKKLAVALFAIILAALVYAQEYRLIDGSGNNKINPSLGSAGTPYVRLAKNSYVDGVGSMRTDLPSPRYITSTLRNSITFTNPTNRAPRSDLLTYYGQMLAHDLLFTSSSSSEPAFISVPSGDVYFDPFSTGNVTIPFARAKYVAGPGNVRSQVNWATSFVDASHVYGSDSARAAYLRSFVGGKLKTSGNNMLPKNVNTSFANDNPSRFVPDNELFVAGDVRVNENPVLASLHTVFMREHNRLCDQLSAKNPQWSDERLYQEARRFVVAYAQAIAFNEYVTAILGDPLPAYTGYNSSMNPSIRGVFSGGAFRYGHTEVNSNVWRLDESRKEIAEKHLLLRDSLFNTAWQTAGVDAVLRGALEQRQQEVDLYFVNDVQNFLFGRSPAHGALDLSALNIQRGRDFGLPFLNDIREAYGLPRYTSFAEITANVQVQDALKLIYSNNINLVELYVGGLAEDHRGLSNLGPTFSAILTEQYVALRDGDRFFYKSPDANFTAAEITEIEQTTLARLILRNTNITKMQCSSFWLPTGTDYDCSKDSIPSSIKSTSTSLLGGSYSLSWVLNSADNTIDFTVSAATTGWVAIGFSSGSLPSMVNSDVIIGYVANDGSVKVDDYYINSRSATCPGGVCADTTMGGTKDIWNVLGKEENGITTIQFRRRLSTGDSKYDVEIRNGDTPVIVAYGNSDTIGYHGSNKAAITINFFTSTVSDATANAKIAHGVIMFLAWWVFLAFGIFAARFTKRILGPFFLQAHLFFQIVGLALVVAGFAVAVMMTPTGSHFNHVHAIFGIITFALSILQAGMGEMTNIMFKKEQKFFGITFSPLEIIHWVLGYFLMICSVVTIFLGFYRHGNVHVAIWILFAVWVLLLTALWLFLHVIPQLRPVSRVTVPDTIGETLAKLTGSEKSAAAEPEKK